MDRTRQIKDALGEIDRQRLKILALLRHGVPFGDAEGLAGALASLARATQGFEAIAREVLPGWDQPQNAVLRHEVRGPKGPRQLAADYAALADVELYAGTMGLRTEVEHGDFSTRLEVRGPRALVEELARYADEDLGRAVELSPDEH